MGCVTTGGRLNELEHRIVEKNKELKLKIPVIERNSGRGSCFVLSTIWNFLKKVRTREGSE